MIDLALHLVTFGRDRCNWLAHDPWETEHRAPTVDDLCPGPRDWYVEVELDGQTILTHICDRHLPVVRDNAIRVHARPAGR